mmetsp:Transcript_53211/g.87000  ORF Transcript_53211/g.87000 Transcript_53211/m.87000 type:complete len:127 (-) Transcript_53211:256-636(-)
MQRLGHRDREIDLLKVDIEGAEYSMFEDLLSNCSLKFKSLNIELHGNNCSQHEACEQHEAFFNAMDRCGYVIVSKETNHWGCDGYMCVEYTFISMALAWEEFVYSHACKVVDHHTSRPSNPGLQAG